MNPVVSFYRRNSALIFRAALFGLLVFATGNRWHQVRGYAPDMGGFERNVIYGIQRLISGQELYQNPHSGSYGWIQYMPAYYHLAAFTGRVAGIDPKDARAVYQLARGMNFFLGLLICLLFYDAARRSLKVESGPAAIGALLTWIVLDRLLLSGRPDALKLFCFTAFLWAVLRMPDWRMRTALPLAMALLVMAFLTKQDGLLFTGILPMAYACGGRWKNAVLLLVVPLSVCAALLLWLNASTGGNFLLNTAGGLHNGISVSWFLGAFGLYFGWMCILFAPACGFGISFLGETDLRLRLLGSAMMCTFFPPFLLSLKFGSGPNYFAEATVISALILTVVLPGLFRLLPEVHRPLFNGIATLTLVLFFLIPGLHWSLGWLGSSDGSEENRYHRQTRVAGYVREHTRGPVMILTNAQWEDYLTTLLFDRVIVPSRDVTSQIYGVKKELVYGNGPSSRKPEPAWAITRSFENPAFPGLRFDGFSADTIVDGYTLWKRNP